MEFQGVLGAPGPPAFVPVVRTSGLDGLRSLIVKFYVKLYVYTHTHDFFLVWGAHFLLCPFCEFPQFAGLCHFIREKVIALCRFWGMLLLILLTFFIHCHLQDFLCQNVVTVAQG